MRTLEALQKDKFGLKASVSQPVDEETHLT